MKMKPSPPLPTALTTLTTFCRLRTGPVHSPRQGLFLHSFVQRAKQVLFSSVEQPLPFLFLLILGTKDFESLPAEVKSI